MRSTGKETRMTEDQIIALHSETSSNTIRALCALALEALELRAENERLRGALEEIAKQKIHKEITISDPDEIDWLVGYEGCVNCARRALERKPE
jgi:regulator of replication initiation timing